MSFTFDAAIIAKIQNEIESDPFNRGYQGQSDSDVAALMNDSFYIENLVQPSRTNQVLVGVAFAPNALTEQDITLVQGGF